jgi:hypothetical protein
MTQAAAEILENYIAKRGLEASVGVDNPWISPRHNDLLGRRRIDMQSLPFAKKWRQHINAFIE